MADVSSRVQTIIDYIGEKTEIGTKELASIANAVEYIHSDVPSDISLIFKRSEEIITATDDIQYTILVLNIYKSKLYRKLKHTKDPQFTMLVRKGRPSTVAIESEIRVTLPEVEELEYDYDAVNNVIEYLQSLVVSLKDIVWSIKDRISLSK